MTGREGVDGGVGSCGVEQCIVYVYSMEIEGRFRDLDVVLGWVLV